MNPAEDGTLPVAEAVRRMTVDRGMVVEELDRHEAGTWTRPYLVRGGPLGDFCESLHDLVGHLLMWDEINLAVITEAGRGRDHWSLRPAWETRDAGRHLNRAGVAAAREIPTGLLVARFLAVRDAVVAELRRYTDRQWAAPAGIRHDRASSTGALIQHVMTVPSMSPYWHAAIHLGRLTPQM